MKSAKVRFQLRKKKVKRSIVGKSNRPRLCVHLGNKHIYAQIINDEESKTLLSASTLSPELKGKLKVSDTIAAAHAVGELLAKKAKEKGVSEIVFDRGGHIYHGKIKALAEAARKAGLKF